VGAIARSLPAQVADLLLQSIVRGELAPGTRLTEIALAEEHVVSRATIREALAQLERQRFVERLPRYGARVAALDVESFLELYEIRAVLLGLASARAAARAMPDELAKLDAKVRQLEQLAARDSTPATVYSQHAIDAQSAILAMSRGRWLGEIYEQISDLTLWRAVLRERALSFWTPERRRASSADYRRLAEAVASGNARTAESAARTLIDASADFIRNRLSARGGSGRARPATVQEAEAHRAAKKPASMGIARKSRRAS
jgi:DNA-binding GntR family transcriptional regulator